MIEMSGKDVEIVFTGLRHGEKVHEDLISVNEWAESPRYPRISHAPVLASPHERIDYASWLAAAQDKEILDGVEKTGSHDRRPLISRPKLHARSRRVTGGEPGSAVVDNANKAPRTGARGTRASAGACASKRSGPVDTKLCEG